MSSTTFTGVIKSGKQGSSGSVALNGHFSFDPTQASAKTGFVLPKGSVVTGITTLGGATGGINPTVDIGNSSTPDAYANELDADTATAGTSIAPISIAVDTEVYAGVGASAATGGLVAVSIQYYRT
jgi:hypothetical protein